MTSKEITERFLSFYLEREHAVIPNVSLIPENDPTLLFVNSGMFPLVQYLMGEPHPEGTRLTNIQRSLRLEDIEEVGKTIRHTTVFHMLGNWSLGDYFKKEQLNWVYEFYIEVLGIDPEKLYATVFEGDENVPKDTESIQILKDVFAKYHIDAKEGERIFSYGKKENWWQRGDTIGELGGPDSEIFYYLGEGNPAGKNPKDNEDEFLEIGNSVFMQYVKTEQGWRELSQKNVDFGAGLERLAMISQKKSDIYETDNFLEIIEEVEKISGKKYGETPQVKLNMRILADHLRASVLLAMDGIVPDNKDQGYVLRRLIRRMVRAGKQLGIEEKVSSRLVDNAANTLEWIYPELPGKAGKIKRIFEEEEDKFRRVINKAEKHVGTYLDSFSGNAGNLAKQAFTFYQSLGYPPEMLMEDAMQKGIPVKENEFFESYEKQVEKHQDKSRAGAEQRFAGGLADQGEQTVRYHTLTHLLHWALREVLGEKTTQQGSNITGERLRFDFSHDGKLTDEEISQVEKLIEEKVENKIPVSFTVMPKEEAEKTGALHFFGDKYGENVKVYYFGNKLEASFSKEFCGGPHVENTSELSPIEIFKQEKIGQGKMRVYARFKP